jgi:hypothetical protein
MNDDAKLAALYDTIAKHATELAGKEWADIHREPLNDMLFGDHEGMITIGDREVPTKVVIEALQFNFVTHKSAQLREKITKELVEKAYRAIED